MSVSPSAGGVWHVPCCGWSGRIFGHSFRHFPLKEIPPAAADFPFEDGSRVSVPALSMYIRTMTQREYVVRCGRCGAL